METVVLRHKVYSGRCVESAPGGKMVSKILVGLDHAPYGGWKRQLHKQALDLTK